MRRSREVLNTVADLLRIPPQSTQERKGKGSTGWLEVVEGIDACHSETGRTFDILDTLQQTDGLVGGQNGAAARLGVPRTTLRKCKTHSQG